MFNLDRHSAEITARTARQNHVSINETEAIARLYDNDTYDTFLARRLGVTPQAIQNWRQGIRKPRPAIAEKIRAIALSSVSAV